MMKQPCRKIVHIRAVSRQFSLDEAYLHVSENKTGLPTATRVASAIREQIRQELNLTASASVASNKFLAKIASDLRKPDSLLLRHSSSCFYAFDLLWINGHDLRSAPLLELKQCLARLL